MQKQVIVVCNYTAVVGKNTFRRRIDINIISIEWGDNVKNTECIAMILAGGQGSRLGALTKKIAK